MFKHILLPTDGSECAQRALRQGAELARAIGAQVTVMTAMEHFPRGIMGSAYRPEDGQQHDMAREIAEQRLNEATELLAGLGLHCHRIVTREQPVHQGILEAARTCGADLIVMGTHGMSALDRLLVGSETQRVLARTEIPVLVMH